MILNHSLTANKKVKPEKVRTRYSPIKGILIVARLAYMRGSAGRRWVRSLHRPLWWVP